MGLYGVDYVFSGKLGLEWDTRHREEKVVFSEPLFWEVELHDRGGSDPVWNDSAVFRNISLLAVDVQHLYSPGGQYVLYDIVLFLATDPLAAEAESHKDVLGDVVLGRPQAAGGYDDFAASEAPL